MSSDSIFTYSYDVVVGTPAETYDAHPHCSASCAGETLVRLGLPDAEPDDLDGIYAYVMPFSEHETETHLTCTACGSTF